MTGEMEMREMKTTAKARATEKQQVKWKQERWKQTLNTEEVSSNGLRERSAASGVRRRVE